MAHMYVSFSSENDAFMNNGGIDETVRILRQIADRIEEESGNTIGVPIQDANGSNVGLFTFEQNDPEYDDGDYEESECFADCDDPHCPYTH